MSRPIGIVAAQVTPVPYDPQATFAKFEREVRLLSSSMPQFDLYVFPELYLSALGSWGYDYPAGYDEQVAEPVPGPLTDRLCALAREVGKWLVPGSIYERSGLTSTTRRWPSRRTVRSWRPIASSSRGCRSRRAVPGDGFTVFDIPGVGRFGLMICYDGWFPEVPRALAWMGAEVILQPTATKTIDRAQEIVLARRTPSSTSCTSSTRTTAACSARARASSSTPRGSSWRRAAAGEEFLTQVIDLDRVTTVREFGTAGQSRMWKQLRDLPVPDFPQYAAKFASGPVMDDLGPLVVRSSLNERGRRGGGRPRQRRAHGRGARSQEDLETTDQTAMTP